MRYIIEDKKYHFKFAFDTETGAYVRTGILDENGKMVQKTENTIGPYDVHDYFIYHFIRHHKSPTELLDMSISTFKGIYTEKELRNWLGIFIKRFFNNQFKRSCIPDGVAVGTVSLSPRGAFIMPSDAYHDEWLKF